MIFVALMPSKLNARSPPGGRFRGRHSLLASAVPIWQGAGVDTAVIRGLAANPGLDLALLSPLFGRDDVPTLVALATRTDLTAAAADTLARHADPQVRRTLARNPLGRPPATRTCRSPRCCRSATTPTRTSG